MSETIFTPQNIGTVLLGVVYAADKGRQAWLNKKYGVGANPKRCRRHADAINAINGRLDNEVIPDLEAIKAKLEIV